MWMTSNQPAYKMIQFWLFQCPESRGQKDCPMKTCASEDLECYVVDNNGFVIISENRADTGKFFGEIDGTILESLVQVICLLSVANRINS